MLSFVPHSSRLRILHSLTRSLPNQNGKVLRGDPDIYRQFRVRDRGEKTFGFASGEKKLKILAILDRRKTVGRQYVPPDFPIQLSITPI